MGQLYFLSNILSPPCSFIPSPSRSFLSLCSNLAPSFILRIANYIFYKLQSLSSEIQQSSLSLWHQESSWHLLLPGTTLLAAGISPGAAGLQVCIPEPLPDPPNQTFSWENIFLDNSLQPKCPALSRGHGAQHQWQLYSSYGYQRKEKFA